MQNRSFTAVPRPPWLTALNAALALVLLSVGTAQAAPLLTISSATLNKKTGDLQVKASYSDGAAPANTEAVLFHSGGGVLATQPVSQAKQKFTFRIPKSQLAGPPCEVGVLAGDTQATKPVIGAPKACKLTPVCKITAPVPAKGAAGVDGQIGTAMAFSGTAKLTDKTAAPLKYEWDFSGGAVGQAMPGAGRFYRDGHPQSANAAVTFVRDNARYRARFAATDAKGHRCEASLMVKIGNPVAEPDSVKAMANAAIRAAPLLGNESAGETNDVVVLPFEEWSMSHDGDMKSVRNGYMAFNPLGTSLNAYAYRKGLKPQSLGSDELTLRYSAAVNPLDPVGPRSINTTSRNYPVTASNDLLSASIQKTDIWNVIADRTPTPGSAAATIIGGLKDGNGAEVKYEVDTAAYRKTPWIMDKYFTLTIPDPANPGKTKSVPGVAPDLDEGAVRAYSNNGVRTLVDDPNNADHGRYMPGKAKPYEVNEPQPFSGFNQKVWNPYTAAFEASPDDFWKAQLIPITGIDDQNRVNPFNLLRVEAVGKNGNSLAKTDGVLSSGRDLHCRECHGRGGIAAPMNPPHTKAACRGSAFGLVSDQRRVVNKRATYPVCEEKPRLFSVEDFGGQPGNLFDEEYAAAMNANSLHEFYDGFYMFTNMQHGTINSTSGKVNGDRPMNCWGCHFSAYQADNYAMKWSDGGRNGVNDAAFYPDFSVSMHRFHGELMWNAAKDGIQRDSRGMYARFDWRKGDKQRKPNANLNPDTLFPIFDSNGKQLPMEESCLKCHGGKREQHYRDRMYTAGVTCYDCHGDMLAMGGAFTKTDGRPGVKDPTSATDTSGEKHDLFRTPWYDEPDCGACHTGKGQEAVLKTAFDPLQPAQMSFKPDLSHPDKSRFAVVPRVQKTLTMRATKPYNLVTQAFENFDEPLTIDAPVFRKGKDKHGNVACAACHGAAHAIWPNRDPNANDNVTALQLQGHTGTIHECNVCHTADSFKNEADLDGGQYSGDAKTGILGGPHNMHPVNDPYWWQGAPGDAGDSTPNKGGKVIGGWHNNYAKKSGKNGEDQCAACHGTDHKGTRLSKTPVEREFVDEKGKKLTVAAGTEIGCGLCHSLEKSFMGTPSRSAQAMSPIPGGGTGTTSGTSASGGASGPMESGR